MRQVCPAGGEGDVKGAGHGELYALVAARGGLDRQLGDVEGADLPLGQGFQEGGGVVTLAAAGVAQDQAPALGSSQLPGAGPGQLPQGLAEGGVVARL